MFRAFYPREHDRPWRSLRRSGHRHAVVPRPLLIFNDGSPVGNWRFCTRIYTFADYSQAVAAGGGTTPQKARAA